MRQGGDDGGGTGRGLFCEREGCWAAGWRTGRQAGRIIETRMTWSVLDGAASFCVRRRNRRIEPCSREATRVLPLGFSVAVRGLRGFSKSRERPRRLVPLYRACLASCPVWSVLFRHPMRRAGVNRDRWVFSTRCVGWDFWEGRSKRSDEVTRREKSPVG